MSDQESFPNPHCELMGAEPIEPTPLGEIVYQALSDCQVGYHPAHLFEIAEYVSEQVTNKLAGRPTPHGW